MAKKITEQEFLERFSSSFPEKKIKLITYTAISNQATIQCLICNKIITKPHARDFLGSCNCDCKESQTKKTKYEKLIELYDQGTEYRVIKKVNKDNVIIKHLICGNEFKRQIGSAYSNPYSCLYCKTHVKKNMLSLEEVQKQIDNIFGEQQIQILDYKGQVEKNHYRCLKCGLIFTQKQVCLVESRGCPKCNRNQSKGEQFIKRLLEEKGIEFREQVAVKELPLQHFDFAVCQGDEIQYFIEVQGDQHYQEKEVFRDGLAVIQERDERKRKYCRKYNIPLYELQYIKGKFKNLEILPF